MKLTDSDSGIEYYFIRNPNYILIDAHVIECDQRFGDIARIYDYTGLNPQLSVPRRLGFKAIKFIMANYLSAVKEMQYARPE